MPMFSQAAIDTAAPPVGGRVTRSANRLFPSPLTFLSSSIWSYAARVAGVAAVTVGRAPPQRDVRAHLQVVVADLGGGEGAEPHPLVRHLGDLVVVSSLLEVPLSLVPAQLPRWCCRSPCSPCTASRNTGDRGAVDRAVGVGRTAQDERGDRCLGAVAGEDVAGAEEARAFLAVARGAVSCWCSCSCRRAAWCPAGIVGLLGGDPLALVPGLHEGRVVDLDRDGLVHGGGARRGRGRSTPGSKRRSSRGAARVPVEHVRVITGRRWPWGSRGPRGRPELRVGGAAGSAGRLTMTLVSGPGVPGSVGPCGLVPERVAGTAHGGGTVVVRDCASASRWCPDPERRRELFVTLG